MVRKRVKVRGHMRTSQSGKRVHIQKHTRLIEGSRTPAAQRWFKPKGGLSGWSKDQPYSTRMYHLNQEIKKRGRGEVTRRAVVSVGRALQALANVTKDAETRRKASNDAKDVFGYAKILEK